MSELSKLNKKALLLLFMKTPELGKVKTRLAADIGEARATAFYKKMVAFIVNETAPKNKHYEQWFYTTGAYSESDYTQWLGDCDGQLEQPEGDLGHKLFYGFKTAFEAGTSEVIALGSDCMEVNAQDIEDCIEKLKSHDAVIGPAFDGGYYLLAFSKNGFEKVGENFESLFKAITWSTAQVFEQTIEKLNQENLNYFELSTKRDIDTLEDLNFSERARKILESV